MTYGYLVWMGEESASVTVCYPILNLSTLGLFQLHILQFVATSVATHIFKIGV